MKEKITLKYVYKKTSIFIKNIFVNKKKFIENILSKNFIRINILTEKRNLLKKNLLQIKIFENVFL